MKENTQAHNDKFKTWGEQFIDSGSFDQMNNAISLPIATAGALMPDAHVGYGLPIGGVLATRNAVIPYAVGVDIACRMRMTIFPQSPHMIGQQKDRFRKILETHTLFGAGKNFQKGNRHEHEVLDDVAWREVGFLRSLLDKAHAQLGTSGSGNHFVEWGSVTLSDDDMQLGVKAGNYLALLSHSGSRGVGYMIANHYSKIATHMHPELPKQQQHLAWLDMNTSIGQEYWASMQLAGRYASANHEVIHDSIAHAMKLKPLAVVENHHNFAWEEEHNGETVIVHRKGATPANHNIYGIIPGSMGDSGFVVRGKGNKESLNSASHGAGRLMSRSQAKKSLTRKIRDQYLKEKGVTLIGGDLDESPQAYKNIHDIMQAQTDLVHVVAEFKPKVVRMDTGKKRK